MTDEDRPGPRRRPAAGGYARGDEKRITIIKAALERFGEDGYEGASTRQIAREAGVNPPAIQYYFDGKEGLYLACEEYIVAGFAESMRGAYERSEAVDPADPRAALEALCDILDAVADFIFEAVEDDGWARFLARRRNNDGAGPHNESLKQAIEGEMDEHFTRLVGVIIGRPSTDVETCLRSFAVMGQFMALHLDRDRVLERLGWPDLRGPRLAEMKAVIRRQTKAALGYPDAIPPER